MMSNVELLAPAGSFDALKAAVQNGADAVYLGGTNFSARAYASNFTRESMIEAVEYCHIRGVKVYVTVNTLVKDGELKDLLQYIAFLYKIDVDAVIVQDLGILACIRNAFPDLEVHCSTQMTLHNSEGIRYIKDLGVKRIVLARELTLDDILRIRQNTTLELEVFVHGALCVCYSGQCLMSSLIGGRSGNRGKCAQPCRRCYDLIDMRQDKKKSAPKSYHLSMRDLNTLEYIGELIDSGITSFKIEGRMKKPQYVASVVRNYRRAIDFYLETGMPLRDSSVQREMIQMFNRKFTKGYLFNSTGNEMVHIEKPGNLGLFLGTISDYDTRRKRLKMKLEEDLSIGDGIEIWSGRSCDHGGIVKTIFVKGNFLSQAKKGQLVEMDMKGDIKKGDTVYKTSDNQLIEKLEKTYRDNIENRKIKIWGDIKIKLGKPLELLLWDSDGNTVYKKSEYITERANKVALLKEKVQQNISKLGNTPFMLEHLMIEIEDHVAVPISVVNQLRRDAVEELIQHRKNRNKREDRLPQDFPMRIENSIQDKKNSPRRIPKVAVKIDRLDHLKAVLKGKIHRVYYGDLGTLKKAVEVCKDHGVKIYYRSSPIIKDRDYDVLKGRLRQSNLDGILAGDLGMVRIAKENLRIPVIADTSLNIMNRLTIDFLQNLGVKGVTLSPELDLKTIEELKADEEIEQEMILYGKLPVMISEYCPLIQLKICNQQCQDCRQRKYHYEWGLRDEKNMIFPMGKDFWGRTILLNSQPLWMLDKIKDLRKMSIDYFRLEFSDEKPAEIEQIVQYLYDRIQLHYLGRIKNENQKLVEMKISHFTRGHYYRGVE